MKSSFFTLMLALLISATTFAQLSGPKTIPGDYATVAEAIAALNANGVGAGGVTFNVAAGHTETFATALSGLITATGTEANPILFQKSGVGNNPKITAGVGTSTTNDGIIVIAGGDYITFDAIDLEENAANANQTTRMEFGYALLKASTTAPINGCQYVTIKNCTITMNKFLTATTFVTTHGIYAGNHTSTAIASISGLSDLSDLLGNCKFNNNTISNVTYGIRISGSVQSLALYDFNNEIGVDGGNTLTDFDNTAINARYQKSLKVANNTIFTNALASNTLYGILIQNTNSCDTYDNTVTLQPATPTTGAYNRSLNGINIYAGETGDTGNIYGNIVENCTTPVTTQSVSFTGIANAAQVTNINMYDNIVRNNAIAGTGSFIGISSGSGVNQNVYDNLVHNNSKTGTNGQFTGMQVGGSELTNAFNNKVYANASNLEATPTTGAAMIAFIINNGNPSNFFSNETYDMTVYGGGTSVANTGISVNNGTLINIYNNFVSDLKAPIAGTFNASGTTNSITGITMTTQPKNVNVKFNTVFLNATSTGVNNFFTSAVFVPAQPIADLRNNILVNLSTPNGIGVTSAYRRSSASLDTYPLTSNANVFYAGDVEDEFHAVFYHGGLSSAIPPIPPTAFNFVDFQAFVGPARESGSFRHLPPFVNAATAPYDLHLIDGFPTPCESGGIQITSPVNITTDFDGDLRSSAPDIGADEFDGMAISVINPGGVVATPQSSHQIDVNFSTNPSNDDVVIVWSTTGEFTAPSGTPPAAGEPFAGGTLLYNGTAAPASHTNLPGATTFYYKAFSYDGTDYSLGITVSANTNIAPPSGFTATAVGATQINLAWTKNAYNNDVIIIANDWDNFGIPVNGEVYTPGMELPDGGTVIYVGPLTAFSHTALMPNIVTYYYQAWSYDPTNMDIYSQAKVTANAATLCSTSTIPYFESFEYGGTSVGCGTVIDVQNNFDTWFANFGFAKTGVISLRINGGFSAFAKDDWYLTNGLELTEGKAYLVKFWYRNQNSNGASHQVEVKWGNSNTVEGMTNGPIYYNDALPRVNTYNQISCQLIIPPSTGIYWVGIHNFTPVAPGSAMFVEDITVEEVMLPAPPNDFIATLNGVDIDLAYTKNAANNDVMIVVNTVPVFGNPAQGTAYAVGSVIGGNGTVLYKGALSAFTHTNLNPSATYYYRIWSVNSTNYYSSTAPEANATTPNFHTVCSTMGWGGISSYLTPENTDIEVVLAGIEEEMQILLGNNGFYWPSQNINTLINWDPNKGYKIKMNEQACFSILGEMTENKTVMLPQGASFMPVLCSESVSAASIFNQLGNNLLFAYDLTSQQLYWPVGGIYTLQNLIPGRAYLVNMIQAGQATFGCVKSTDINPNVNGLPVYESAPWTYNQSGEQHFISIHSSALASLEKGTFIGVFNAQGVCVGLTQYNGEAGNLLLVAYGDDNTTSAIDGLTNGEMMSFKVFGSVEKAINVEYSAELNNSGKFADMGQSMIMKLGENATGIGEGQLSDMKLYPNPGNGAFTLEIPRVDQRVEVKVENSLGQVIYTELIEASQTGSTQKINLSSATSGIYFVKISYNDVTLVSKLIVR